MAIHGCPGPRKVLGLGDDLGTVRACDKLHMLPENIVWTDYCTLKCKTCNASNAVTATSILGDNERYSTYWRFIKQHTACRPKVLFRDSVPASQMTIREAFAASIIQGLMVVDMSSDAKVIARQAVIVADALLEALAEPYLSELDFEIVEDEAAAQGL